MSAAEQPREQRRALAVHGVMLVVMVVIVIIMMVALAAVRCMMLPVVIIVVIVMVTARMMFLVIIIVVVMMSALGAELRLDRRGAGVVVAQESVFNGSIARLQRKLDLFREPFDLGGEVLAGGKANVRLRPRGAAGACNARGGDGERAAADQKDYAGAQQPDFKQRC